MLLKFRMFPTFGVANISFALAYSTCDIQKPKYSKVVSKKNYLYDFMWQFCYKGSNFILYT